MLETFGVEKGITVFGNEGVAKLFWQNFSGSTPSNGFGANGDYAIDSISGHFYKKSAGTWAKHGISADVASSTAGFRIVEGFEYYTEIDVSAFTGLTQTMDAGVSVTFTVGDKVATGFSDEVYVASGSAWTLYGTQPTNNDVMFIQNVLSDSSYQKGVSMFKFTTGPNTFTKIADFDFEIATTMGFSGYSKPAAGSVTAINGASDSVQGSIEKLDTITDNILAALGLTLTDINLGTMTGLTVASNSTVKNAIQSIVDKTRYEVNSTGITTSTAVDSVAVATYKRVQWLVEVVSTATATDRYSVLVNASNDGATGVAHSFSGIIQQGSVINGLTITTDISSGNMRLNIASTQAVDVKAVRYTI